MGGITVGDVTSGVAFREISGLGRQEGRHKGRQTEALALTLRLLERRCPALTPSRQTRFSPSPSAPSKPCSLSSGDGGQGSGCPPSWRQRSLWPARARWLP